MIGFIVEEGGCMYLKNDRGATLILIIVVFSVIVMLGTVMFTLQMAEAKTSIRHRNETEAYYIARSAVESAVVAIDNKESDLLVEIVKETPDTIVLDQFQVLDSSGTTVLANFNTASVEITKINSHQIRVSGTAEVSGVEETESVIMDNNSFIHAIHAMDILDINGMDSIIGEDIALDPNGTFNEANNPNSIPNYEGMIREDFEYSFDMPEPILPSDSIVGQIVYIDPDSDGFYEYFNVSGDTDGDLDIDIDDAEYINIGGINGCTFIDENADGTDDYVDIDGDGDRDFIDSEGNVVIGFEVNSKNNDDIRFNIELEDELVLIDKDEAGIQYVARYLIEPGSSSELNFHEVVDSLVDGGDEDRVLILYIDGSMFFDFQTSQDALYDADQLGIFLDSGAVLDITGNHNLNAYIFGPDATVNFKTGNIIFTGSIIAHTYDGDAQSILIYEAPDPNGVIEVLLGLTNDDNFRLIYWE